VEERSWRNLKGRNKLKKWRKRVLYLYMDREVNRDEYEEWDKENE
jgi:hypothetical protein